MGPGVLPECRSWETVAGVSVAEDWRRGGCFRGEGEVT